MSHSLSSLRAKLFSWLKCFKIWSREESALLWRLTSWNGPSRTQTTFSFYREGGRSLGAETTFSREDSRSTSLISYNSANSPSNIPRMKRKGDSREEESRVWRVTRERSSSVPLSGKMELSQWGQLRSRRTSWEGCSENTSLWFGK